MEKLIFGDGSTCYLDINYFKHQYNEGNLKNSEIFALLFKLKESNFKNIPMEMDEKGNILICKSLNISYNEWGIFLKFLKSGKTPYVEDYNDIPILLDISNKFGNIKAIDIFYKNYMEKNSNIYNPMRPEDDKFLKYDWTVSFTSLDSGYSCTVPVDIKNLNRMYARKIKKDSS